MILVTLLTIRYKILLFFNFPSYLMLDDELHVATVLPFCKHNFFNKSCYGHLTIVISEKFILRPSKNPYN